MNGKIFVGQGKALRQARGCDVRILVVGNPCNTNCLVAYTNGRDIPADRWTAMTRLDHNRAAAALAKKAGVANEDVTCMTIWGNHSNTQYPRLHQRQDQRQAGAGSHYRSRLAGKHLRAADARTAGRRSSKPRGFSSAFSAANGAIDHVKSLLTPTPAGDWVSAATVSNGEYGVPAGLVFGYPCRSDGKGNLDRRGRRQARRIRQAKFDATLKELLEERDAVKELIPT